MALPYELHVIDSCVTCKVKEEHLFCNLKGSALQELERVKFSVSYPSGSILYSEGEPPRGIMIICQGKAKLSMSSASGKNLIVKIAEAGEVLGLSATISRQPHQSTAETVEPTQINIIRPRDFEQFLKRHPDACMNAAQELSSVHNAACHEIRMLGLSQSIPERLARLLLAWQPKKKEGSADKMQITLTHEEISEFLGTSRETVSRTLMDFKRRKIVGMKGATLTILDRSALQAAAGEPGLATPLRRSAAD